MISLLTGSVQGVPYQADRKGERPDTQKRGDQRSCNCLIHRLKVECRSRSSSTSTSSSSSSSSSFAFIGHIQQIEYSARGDSRTGERVCV